MNTQTNKNRTALRSSKYTKNMTSKYIKYLACMTFIMMAFMQDLAATHVVGGNLSYRHVSGDMYEITLTFRRDCDNGSADAAFDNPANVWIFNGNGNLQTNLGVNGRLKMNFNPDDTLNNIITSECGFEGSQVCVHETTYREMVRLPIDPGDNGYILAYQRCCRNATLENIVDPLLTGGTWSVRITEHAMQELNANPVFNEWPDIYICANEDLIFDHSAVDPDGDSLVYRLCTPFEGADTLQPIPQSSPNPPYVPVTWKPPYGLDNLLGGIPLQIDPQTGLLTGNPNLVGQFLVGICVEEFRDGVKIGEVRRDFQYNVRICSDPPTAEFEANGGDCDGPEVQFDNLSLGGNGANYQWNFNFPSTDPAFFSTEENPFFDYGEQGVYDVQLIVTRGSDSCSDTVVTQVAALFSDILVKYDLMIQSCNEDGGYTIRLIDRSVETEEGFEIIDAEFTITQGGSSQVFNSPVVTLDIDNEDFIIELQTESSTGCKKTLIDTIDIDDFAFIADFVFELDGCMEGGIASIAFGDVSDPLNIYDSPEGYDWTVTSVLGESTFSDSSFVVDVSITETITVDLVVDFGGGCMASVSKTINVEDIRPQASYDLEPLQCPDDGTVDLTFINTSDANNPDYGVASTEWTITSGGATATSTESTFTTNVPKDSIVEVMLITEFDNECRDTIFESFVPGPFATIAFDAEPFKVCLGDSVHFVTNPNSDFTYTWSPMDGLFFEDPTDLSDPQIIGISDTEYTVTVSDGLCFVESSIAFIVLDSDNLDISGDSIVCDGNVSLTASGGIGEGDYIWSLTSDFADIIHTGEVLETNFTGQEQTFYMAFTGESCDDPFAEYTVILSNIYDVVFNGDPVRVCLGDTVPLLANPDPSLTYIWSPLDGGITFDDATDGSTAMVIGVENTSYNVTIEDDFCSLDTFIEVIIADTQEFQVLGDSIVCTDSIQLVGFGASGIGTYQWSLDPDFTTILHTGDTLNTVLTDISTTYYVTFTDNTCGDLVLSYSVRKFVFDILTVEPVMICPGDTNTYNVFNQGEGPVTFLWDPNPHIVANGNTASPTIGVGPDETEDFEISFEATSPTGCTYRDTISYEIADNPVVDFDFTLTECGELTVCFEIIGEYNGFPNWNFGDPTTEEDISIEAAPCYTYPTAGMYDVTLGNLSTFCPFADTIKTVTVNDDIAINPIEDRIVCLGDSVFITANSDNVGVEFVWCNLAGDTIALGPDYAEQVNEMFQVIVKAEDPNGCTDMDTIKVSPFEFDVTGTFPEIFCDTEDTNIEIFVNGEQEGYSFEWGPEDCVISGGNTVNPVLVATDAKEFTVTITFDSLGCVFEQMYEITTTSFEIDLQAEPDTVINQGDEVIISVIDPFDDYMYEWSDGTSGEELTDTPEESTTYYVTVTDEMGCTATDSIFVRVRIPTCDESDIYLPTAFTPNGDNSNDVLFLRSNFVDEMELLIYDRWGEEVFRTTDQNRGWDGTYNGDKLSPDVYAYTLYVLCINGVEYRTRGNVSLLK